MRHDGPTVARYVLAAVALVAMVALAPFFVASGLMAPGWAVAVFVTIWAALFLVGCLWIRRRPLRVVPLPFIAVAVWFGGMTAGGELLGWTP
jgi:intracellular septation protein A